MRPPIWRLRHRHSTLALPRHLLSSRHHNLAFIQCEPTSSHLREFWTMSPRSGRSPPGGLASRTGWIGSVARFWEACLLSSIIKYTTNKSIQKTYAPDYVGFAVLITAYILVCLTPILESQPDGLQIQFFMEPFHRMFVLNNLNIQYPHALVERVSVGWNMFYAGAVPLLTLVLFLGLSRASLHKFHITILGLLISYVPLP